MNCGKMYATLIGKVQYHTAEGCVSMSMERTYQKREIRPLTEADLEAYLDIYLNSYPAYKTLDAECREHYREKHRLELREDRQVKTVGLFEDGVLLSLIHI